MTLPEGWLDADDQRELERYARGRLVLEMGAWKGRSTVVLANVAAYVISVDRHRGISGHDSDSLPAYLDAVRGLDNVAIVVARFGEFVPLLDGVKVGYVFIDGDHETDAVQRDTLTALLLDPPIVAYHDWDFPDVRAAVEPILGQPTSVGGSVATFVRRKD